VTHSLHRKKLQKEDKTWRQNFQYDVCKDSVEDPDGFSLAELGFCFIARQRGS
jgi:hypothetical protein